MLLEKLKAFGMVAVVCVDVGVQRPGVDQERYGRTSARRISSIRSEVSDRPLAPAAAAISWRRPRWEPKCSSIASLVTSETVVARRSASWRRRASNSSGSLTVVLFTVCQHTRRACPRCPLSPGAPPWARSARIVRFHWGDSVLEINRRPTGLHVTGGSRTRLGRQDPEKRAETLKHYLAGALADLAADT